MVLASDPDYIETKRIKKGLASINPLFQPLADWINLEYDVRVLNIYYHKANLAYENSFPRLNIIFENEEDELKFRDGRLGNFDMVKQKVIEEKFEDTVKSKSENSLLNRLLSKTGFGSWNTTDLYVIFSSFKSVAMGEINESIPHGEIAKLKDHLANPQIWEISRFWFGVTFFFYNNEQVESVRNSGYMDKLKEEYFNLLKKYDEFDYFDWNTFSISIDSKENFDRLYKSNWYYYYK